MKTASVMADYTEKRRNGFYAVWTIPKPARHAFGGRHRLIQTTKTTDPVEAKKRARMIVDGWQRVAQAATGQGDVIAARAAVLREALLKARTPEERESIQEHIGFEADALAGDYGPDDDEDDAGPDPQAIRFHRLATGEALELEPLIAPWLASKKVKAKTAQMEGVVLRLLSQHHPIVQDVTRRVAVRFVEDVLAPDSSEATVKRKLTALRTFWDWLRNRGELPETSLNPWSSMPLPAGLRAEQERRPFTEDEASAFLAAVDASASAYPADPLVVRIMTVTGMRVEEVAALKQGAVKVVSEEEAWISLSGDLKTDASVRRVPIVAPEVVAALAARFSSPPSPSSSLFPEFQAGSFDRLSHALSNRLGRLLRKKITKDPQLVANHSWRHRGRTIAERAGIEPWTCDFFFGHARPGEGAGRYSQGPSDDQLLRLARVLPLPVPRPPSTPP